MRKALRELRIRVVEVQEHADCYIADNYLTLSIASSSGGWFHWGSGTKSVVALEDATSKRKAIGNS
ncbi:MAG: hypothetical protein JXX14_00815 [Deltaproteobacteria bacterium]|nr:hypothetical protein [Deltaproteobacteria bacterium]